MIILEMENRAIAYSGPAIMPVVYEIQPMGLNEFNYLTRERELILYRDIDGDTLISEPKIYREKMAIVANAEAVYETVDNVIMIPNVTKGYYSLFYIARLYDSYNYGSTVLTVI